MTERSYALDAQKAQVAEQTLRRWLATDQAFLAAYRAARRADMDRVVGRLQRAGAAAVDAVERNPDKASDPRIARPPPVTPIAG